VTKVRQPVAITGVGAVTCLGVGAQQHWSAASTDLPLQSGLGVISDDLLSKLCHSFPNLRKFHGEKALLLALAAIQEAMTNAGWSDLGQDDGFVFATTTGDILLWDRQLINELQTPTTGANLHQLMTRQSLGHLRGNISQHLKHTGPSRTLSSACSASTQGLALALDWLNSGQIRRCLVGSVEVLCDLTVRGFSSLQLLAKENCRPFDKNRSGIRLSEGAGFLCLEASAKKQPLAWLCGAGLSSDGYHATSPHPQGDGIYAAMAKALKSAGIRPTDLSWIHAHGTGSQQNDSSEGHAIHRLLEGATVPVSSTKAVHGHTLGAAGAIESILVVEALGAQKIIPTWGLIDPDPQILIEHPKAVQSKPLNYVLKNTAGFGGANASLVFKRAEACDGP
jgi:3-oxoacyl-(acyl-carrier-protein) synthase